MLFSLTMMALLGVYFLTKKDFASYKLFFNPPSETLDDATVCGLGKYANQCLVLFFKRSIVPANGGNASSETQQGCHRRGH